jgi:hypothetical protein
MDDRSADFITLITLVNRDCRQIKQIAPELKY